jgi:hypothetical protein
MRSPVFHRQRPRDPYDDVLVLVGVKVHPAERIRGLSVEGDQDGEQGAQQNSNPPGGDDPHGFRYTRARREAGGTVHCLIWFAYIRVEVSGKRKAAPGWLWPGRGRARFARRARRRCGQRRSGRRGPAGRPGCSSRRHPEVEFEGALLFGECFFRLAQGIENLGQARNGFLRRRARVRGGAKLRQRIVEPVHLRVGGGQLFMGIGRGGPGAQVLLQAAWPPAPPVRRRRPLLPGCRAR